MTCKFMYKKGVLATRNEPFTGKEGDIIAINGEEYKVATAATINSDLQMVRLLRKGEREDYDGAFRRILADIREI